MGYLNKQPNYDKFPKTKIDGYDNQAYAGYQTIISVIRDKLSSNSTLVIDCYPGVNTQEVVEAFRVLDPKNIVCSDDIFFEEDVLTKMMEPNLTDDRVRGVMFYGTYDNYIDQEKLKVYQEKVASMQGLTIVYGVGARKISRGDVLVYADLARWEIQLRYRKGLTNFKCSNPDEDILRKYKRAFFIEWRIADRHKQDVFSEMDFYLDTNIENNPKMITGQAFNAGLEQIVKQPFRLVPYFDPGVWGGQWMKEVCQLDPKEDNFAWSFDGVMEENSIYLQYGDIVVESPGINVVHNKPIELLGEKNFARFGAEYPIRFDFLDTMGGQNLSLQVHPDTEYIKNNFGMPYTQDESYYILDCEEGGGVFLGFKEDVNKEEMIQDLRDANAGKISFNAKKYVNFFEAKKHDHYLIPAGTIHCSSNNCMVLEISATPYIFTFKLWDWDRVGLDGIPRPVHVEDGKEVLRFDRTTPWVEKNLVNDFTVLEDTEQQTVVKTGLHELEFIETHVITTSSYTSLDASSGVHMLNLVDGYSAVVESPDNSFEPFTVHYAETFIIPASVGKYTIRSIDGTEIKVLQAYVRN